LQQRLDGEPKSEPDSVERHVGQCPACRALEAAAERLEEGLRLLRPVAPPQDLGSRIVAEVLAGRRQRERLRYRRWALAGAVAASLLLAVFAGYSWRPNGPGAMVKDLKHQEPAPTTPKDASLDESVQEASSALVSLMNRTADQAVEQGRVLIPPVPVPALPAADAWQAPLEQPVASLRTARQGVAAGLEPVTKSAVRAVNLFWREIPRL
jgi:predicted anti-sigma-YlaC factor YlaD